MPSAEVNDFVESAERPFDRADGEAGASQLSAAAKTLSRSVAAFAGQRDAAGPPPAARRSSPRGVASLADLSAPLNALLASVDREVPPPASVPASALRAGIPPAAQSSSFARSLAALVGEDNIRPARDRASEAAVTGRRNGAASLPRGPFSHLPDEQFPGGRDSLDGSPLDGSLDNRRSHDRQQRQLEALLRIERLLDETVRLLRQPRAAVFAADTTGVP